jgi:DNA helicase-2/ATP-dependent DNA helicase PcrA
MGNKLIVAAAGSGKTTFLVNKALELPDGKILITTFTEANESEIKKKFIELHGCIPSNVTVQTWFSFLIQHGVRPYQSVIFEGNVKGLLLVNQKSGLRYAVRGRPVYWGEKDLPQYYFSGAMRVYSDKISKFVYRANALSNGLVVDRLSRIYSHIFIDEVQDLAGYDLELVRLFVQSPSDILMVGDPRQVTYHTHDEAKNKQYEDGKIESYINEQCRKISVEIDKETLNVSYRNKKDICEFANQIYPDYAACGYIQQDTTDHDGVFFVKPADIDDYLRTFHPIQLRDKVTVAVNPQYGAMNFGDAKGLTFERVLIYPTKPMLDWITNHSKVMKSQSRSKLYVAITRARHSVGIVFDNKKNIAVNGIQEYRQT